MFDTTDERKVEEQARTMLYDAFESIDQGLALYDHELRFVMYNHRFLDGPYSSFGTQPPLLGEYFSEHALRLANTGLFELPEESTPSAFADELVEAVETYAKNLEVSLTNGRMFHCSANKTKLGGCLITITEITDSKRAEKAEQESAELLHNVVEACPANFLMSRIKDGEVLYRSPASKELFGEQPSARGHWSNPEDRTRYLETLERDGRVDNMFVFGLKSDGTSFPSQVSARIVEHNNEKVIVSSTTDLTEAFALRDERSRADARLRDAIEALGEGFVLYDENECFVMANERYRQAMAPYQPLMKPGAPMTAITGQAIKDGHIAIVNPLEDSIEDVLKTVKAGSPSQVEIQFSNGSHHIVSLSRLGDGGLVATMLDITDRRRMQDRAREMLEDAVESLGEGVALYDSDTRLMMNNGAFRNLVFGDRPLSAPGMPLIEEVRNVIEAGMILVPEGEDVEAVLDRILESVKTCTTGIELPMVADRTLEVSNFATPLGGYLISMRDITEKKQAERATREANELVRTIVEASPTSFLVSRIDDGEVIYFSPTSREIFGDVKSTRDLFVEHSDWVACWNEMKPRGILDDFRAKFRRRDGSIMDGLISARIASYNGQDVVVSSTQDITDQLAMQAELERQRNIAHQNEKLSALGELLAGVAHELNNPLSIVVGYALMLQNKIEDPKQKQQIERIGEAAERCAKIVKMFLAMARQRPTRIENCSLNEILETALDVACYGLKAAGVRVKLQLGKDIPLVLVDPDQIAQVFINLIANAEHALADCGEDGRLKLITMYDKTANEVVVKIRDNGAGVPKDIQPRIFEPFFTTKDVGVGTGVGLAFSHRIITSHQGLLTLHSVPGDGATFIIRMPAVVGAANIGVTMPEITNTVRNRKVLVVDDEIGVTDLIRDILEEYGYEVEIQNDARRALALLKTQNFDAIISDMKMPGLDGEAFIEQLKATDPNHTRRFAFVTGDTMSSRAADYLESTATPHLEKPVTPAELIELVEKLCRQSKDDTT